MTAAAGGWGGAIQGGAGIIGSVMQMYANQQAQKRALKGLKQQTQAIQAGQAQFNRVYQETAPARQHLTSLVASDPNILTADQRNQLATTRRSAINQLSTTGLRGSGRAQSGVLRRIDVEGRGNMIADNTRRADLAAGYLTGQGYAANTAAANMYGQIGDVMAQTGLVKAGAGQADAQVMGSTLGKLADSLSTYLERRPSRYQDPTGSYAGDFSRAGGRRPVGSSGMAGGGV